MASRLTVTKRGISNRAPKAGLPVVSGNVRHRSYAKGGRIDAEPPPNQLDSGALDRKNAASNESKPHFREAVPPW